NVSSTGSSARRSQPKRRKASPDRYDKRRRADTEESENNQAPRDERTSSVSSTHTFQPITITAPDPAAFRFDLPQPSPATCGKRKVRDQGAWGPATGSFATLTLCFDVVLASRTQS